MKFYIENLRIFMSSNESYRLSYMRATPFFSGLATSIIVQKLKEKKVKFSRITVYGGTFIVFVICISAQLYGAKFYTWLRPYYPLEHALYKVVNNCTLTVLCMWCFICFFTFGYGNINWIIKIDIYYFIDIIGTYLMCENGDVGYRYRNHENIRVNPSSLSWAIY
ncbi:nose resistant to fluoxetine protein 6-like isoform X3 [Aphis craccivora]|uniref:Nose resistant to fluoxetine protein 6-like isoform X3 n=1 Tax=Aphis craccivora TaxID=307492 RepID=A0A6G0VL19_APHCR|nr:nose resistant to fluoxetine protein 6-like isoform X3 [Aphis craccivora]